MGCIYYMYIVGSSVGYIGQDSGDGINRISDHIKSASSASPDAVGRMINQYGLDKLRYKLFEPPLYGIPQEIYDLFQQQWKYSGSGATSNLDLAELLHIVRAKLLNTSAAKFNTLIGGFQASGLDATLTYELNIPNNISEKSIQNILSNFRQELVEKRFSVNLQKFDESWKKIVYPIAYLMLTGPFKEALLKYVQDDLIEDLFSATEVIQIIKDYCIESLKNPQTKSIKPTAFNNKIKQEIRRQFSLSTSVVSRKIKQILHQSLGAHYLKEFHFS